MVGVQPAARPGLNDSGEIDLTRIVAGGAVHVSYAQRTLQHAHYAWKIVVGLDAPVWLRSHLGSVHESEAVRAVIVPPGFQHQVGAVGWSCTLFSAPGQRNTPWHTSLRHWTLGTAVSGRLIGLCWDLVNQTRLATPDFVDEIFGLVFADLPHTSVDPRVKRVLTRLMAAPDEGLSQMAGALGLSADRLSHLVKQDTGMALRKHLVWSRLLALLSTGERHTSIAAAAAAAGFADHAHLTRTYRTYLGRLPSDFTGPPDVLRPW